MIAITSRKIRQKWTQKLRITSNSVVVVVPGQPAHPAQFSLRLRVDLDAGALGRPHGLLHALHEVLGVALQHFRRLAVLLRTCAGNSVEITLRGVNGSRIYLCGACLWWRTQANVQKAVVSVVQVEIVGGVCVLRVWSNRLGIVFVNVQT